MKSNEATLPKVDAAGDTPRLSLALGELRAGRGLELFAQARRMVARMLASALPKLECREFLKGVRLDVVDVGAAGGLHRRWRPYLDFIRGHLFDPEPNALKHLGADLTGNPNMRVYPYALSDSRASVDVNIMAYSRASSVYAPDSEFLEKTTLRNHLKPVKKLTFEARPMDELVEHADFIKIDVEGFELSVLKGANRLLDGALALELEVAFFDRLVPAKPVFADIDAFCRARGFVFVHMFDSGRLHYILNDMRYEIGGLLYSSNVLYVRLPDEVVAAVQSGKLPIESIWKIAFIYVVYGQLELAKIITFEARKLSFDINERERLSALHDALEHYAGINGIISRRALTSLIELIGPLD